MTRGSSGLPELLAPAGSPDAFRAAIAAGADAIYLSGKRFGARKYAANFTDAEIEEAVSLAHAHGIRVYVTVNTLIHDRELAGALGYLLRLWSIGVDAVLVQDTGLAALARQHLPDLPLHASTQLTIHNAEGVRWAAEAGFSRVVLARELSLDEVARIAEATKDTGTGLEVFAHGALCYGYSGQCLLSSVIGGRSGNRGMCAQPCRKPYTLVKGPVDEYGRPEQPDTVPLRDPYLLSPRDLCTYRHLPELVRSPVASLKIEGRMKSPEYVAIVVSTYRRALDAIARGPWSPSVEAYRDLLLAFNRGFTKGYLFGDRYEALMGRDAPGNRGLEAGRVVRFDRKKGTADIRPAIPLVPAPGDGILVADPERPGRELGFALNTVPVATREGYSLALPSPVPAGAKLYITSSRELEARAHRIVAKPPADLLRPLPVDLDIAVDPDGSLRFDSIIHRPDGLQVPVPFAPSQKMEPAKTRPLSRDQLEEQFRKSGGTPFLVRRCDIRYNGSHFAPVSVLNEIRRGFFRHAEERLAAVSRPDPGAVARAKKELDASPAAPAGKRRHPGSPLRIAVYASSPESAGAAVSAGAGTVCFEPRVLADRHLCGDDPAGSSLRPQLLAARECCRKGGALLVWKFPRIAHDDELTILLQELAFQHGNGLSACMAGNHGTLRAIRNAVPDIHRYGSSGLNIFNHAAATRLPIPCRGITLSPELSREEIARLTARAGEEADAPEFSLVVQGSTVALVTEDCIPRLARHCSPGGPGFLGLRDGTGRVFPLTSSGSCRTAIANSVELCLIDHLPAIAEAGISEIVIDARDRPPAYAGTMVSLYREAARIAESAPGKARSEALALLKEQAKAISRGGITAGHFLRGLAE